MTNYTTITGPLQKHSQAHNNITHIFTYGSERPFESMAMRPAQRLMPTVRRSLFVLYTRLTKIRPRSGFIKSSSFSTFKHNAPVVVVKR